VTGLNPATGPAAGGTTVTITGTDFTGATDVKFGTSAASSFTVNSDTSITARTPAEYSGVVDVTVTTPAATSATGAADRFTFGDPAATPTLSEVGLLLLGLMLAAGGGWALTREAASRIKFGD
jgi:hypothetical protein